MFEPLFSGDDGHHEESLQQTGGLASMLVPKKRRGSGHATLASHMELNQLRAFVALVDNGSVTAAGQALGLAQSTVSEAIVALERELGTVLTAHKRGARTVSLTSAGRALLPRARGVLSAVEKTYLAVAQASVTARGAVNIITNESVSTYLLSQVLTTKRRRWRNTQLAVSVAACPEVRAGIRSGAFDLGLLLSPANRKSTINATSTNSKKSEGAHIVAPLVPLVIFATALHPLVKSVGSALARRCDLDSFPVFVSDAAGEYRALLERFFGEDDLLGPRLESTGSIEGVKAAVWADPRALGILPSYAVTDEIQTGRAVPLDLRPTLPPMQIVALSGSRALHPSTPELLDELGRICATLCLHRALNPHAASTMGATVTSGRPS